MAGNARSGRRPAVPPAVRAGRPAKPKKLNADETYFWESVIGRATHLEAIDSVLCEAATRAWGLYAECCREAKSDPRDKDVKSAVSSYGALLDKLCARLGVDPLGRARHRAKAEIAADDPLREFDLR